MTSAVSGDCGKLVLPEDKSAPAPFVIERVELAGFQMGVRSFSAQFKVNVTIKVAEESITTSVTDVWVLVGSDWWVPVDYTTAPYGVKDDIDKLAAQAADLLMRQVHNA